MTRLRDFWTRLRENPIVRFHLSRKRWVPTWLVAGLGIGVWLVSLAGVVYLLWQPSSYIFVTWIIAFYTIWFAPMLIGGMGRQFANREIKHQRHQLILMTPLPAVEVVWGYMIVALYRARVLVAIFLGMSPVLATFVAFFNWGPWPYLSGPVVYQLSMADIARWLASTVAIMLLICAMLPLLLVSGINASVYQIRMKYGRDTPVLTQVRLYFGALFVALCMIPWLPGGAAVLIAAQYDASLLTLGFGLLAMVVILLLLWLSTWLLIRLAVSNLRKAPVPGE